MKESRVKRIGFIILSLLLFRIIYVLQCSIGYIGNVTGLRWLVKIMNFPLGTRLGISIVVGLLLGYLFKNKLKARSIEVLIIGLLIAGTLFFDPMPVCDFTYKYIWSGVYTGVIQPLVQNHVTDSMPLGNYDMVVYYHPDAVLNLVVGYCIMMVEIFFMNKKAENK